jgi:cell volume regulation protein A
MIDVTLILFGASLILFFGFFAGWVFKKISVPDVLFLIILGFVIGPNVLNYISLESLGSIAPVFTTFTLLFLLFDGAFNINLSSLIREFSSSFVLTMFNFIISTLVVGVIVYVFGLIFGLDISILVSLLTGFLLGGVSSSFVIPVLQQMKIKEKLYSLLTLESALTDVFCIVGSLTILEIISIGSFGLKATMTQIASIFAVAGLIGIIGGIIWIVLIVHLFKEHNYMITIAYLILLFVFADFLVSGSGALSALFFGLMLKNSKQLSSIIKGITTRDAREKKKALKGELGVSVTTPSEQYFYHQISFFLKTFFFVYIGLLLDLTDTNALIIGAIISVAVMFSRTASNILTKAMEGNDRALVNSMFARGLAAAAIAQLAITAQIPHALFVAKVSYVVITLTIVLSSIKVFFVKRRMPDVQEISGVKSTKVKKRKSSSKKKVTRKVSSKKKS